MSEPKGIRRVTITRQQFERLLGVVRLVNGDSAMPDDLRLVTLNFDMTTQTVEMFVESGHFAPLPEGCAATTTYFPRFG